MISIFIAFTFKTDLHAFVDPNYNQSSSSSSSSSDDDKESVLTEMYTERDSDQTINTSALKDIQEIPEGPSKPEVLPEVVAPKSPEVPSPDPSDPSVGSDKPLIVRSTKQCTFNDPVDIEEVTNA